MGVGVCILGLEFCCSRAGIVIDPLPAAAIAAVSYQNSCLLQHVRRLERQSRRRSLASSTPTSPMIIVAAQAIVAISVITSTVAVISGTPTPDFLFRVYTLDMAISVLLLFVLLLSLLPASSGLCLAALIVTGIATLRMLLHFHVYDNHVQHYYYYY